MLFAFSSFAVAQTPGKTCVSAAGTAEKQFAAGEQLESGKAGVRNLWAAINCYERAAAQGHAPSMARLGVLFYNGDVLGDSIPADPKLAWTWLTLARVHGETSTSGASGAIEAELTPTALEQLRAEVGQKLLAGKLVPKNAAKAISLYESFAEAGSHSAEAALGDLYAGGEYVELDLVQATKWYERAAISGSAEAMMGLGKIAETQTPPDYARAVRWYNKVIEIGGPLRPRATYCVARVAERSTPPDMKRAVQMYTRAASLLEVEAMNRLGELYAQGTGVKRDVVEATAWLTLCSYNNSRKCTAALSDLESKLTQEELGKAKVRAQKLIELIGRPLDAGQ